MKTELSRVRLGFIAEMSRDLGATGIKVPNEHVWKVVQKYPDCFFMAMSVHPYRDDAVEEIEKWGGLGVKIIKWLPNSMNIDLEHRVCINPISLT